LLLHETPGGRNDSFHIEEEEEGKRERGHETNIIIII
jgi:hypothetical protein